MILKLNEERYSKTVNRSGKVIMNLLKDPDNYGERQSCGRLQCLTARDNTHIASKLDYETNCRKF